LRISFVIKGACLLAAVSLLAAPPVKGAAVSFPAEPLAAAPARPAFLSLKTLEHSDDAAAAVRELTALVESIPARRSDAGVRFPSPVPPLLVRNPFLSTAP